MLQRRNNTARSPYGRLAMAVVWHTVFTLSWVPRKSYGVLTAPLRRPYGKLVVAATTVRSPHGPLPASLRSPFLISWIVRSPCGRRNICDHNYRSPQDLTIFKNQVLQTIDRRTVRRPYGGSMICDRGITQQNGRTERAIPHNWLAVYVFPLYI